MGCLGRSPLLIDPMQPGCYFAVPNPSCIETVTHVHPRDSACKEAHFSNTQTRNRDERELVGRVRRTDGDAGFVDGENRTRCTVLYVCIHERIGDVDISRRGEISSQRAGGRKSKEVTQAIS